MNAAWAQSPSAPVSLLGSIMLTHDAQAPVTEIGVWVNSVVDLKKRARAEQDDARFFPVASPAYVRQSHGTHTPLPRPASTAAKREKRPPISYARGDARAITVVRRTPFAVGRDKPALYPMVQCDRHTGPRMGKPAHGVSGGRPAPASQRLPHGPVGQSGHRGCWPLAGPGGHVDHTSTS